ncbi:hypothetical protein F9K50_07210 [bacterium]|nr:MAG: hypothetical protein F9K50_07210 [bacterium]
MKVYLTLLFTHGSNEAFLERWLSKMGTELRVGDALFSFHAGGKAMTFPSPASGTLKVTLCREGEALQRGAAIAVFLSPEAPAKELEKKGLGKILTPDEYQEALAHAEAASIRLPPEEL